MQEKFERGMERLTEKFDLPKEVILNIPKITIIGNKDVTIENHSGIIVFSSDVIKINTKIKPITIIGEDFEILYIGDSTITISGKFKTIKYEE